MALETVPLHLGFSRNSKGLKMKSNAWKKDFVVIMYSDYDHTWIEKTIPLTYLQAVRFISAKNWNHSLVKGIVKIVTLTELQSIKTLVRV